MLADLHTHTNNSDGLYSVEELIDRALRRGVNCLAITDHDTIGDLRNGIKIAKEKGLILIPGIELSTLHNGESIHILGFFKDFENLDEGIIESLIDQKNNRIKRAKEIIRRLKEYHNIEIEYESIAKNANGIIARPHIAKAIIEGGYPYTKDYIFKNILGDNCKAYVPSTKISVEEGIAFLKKANCLVVLAHPVLIKKTPLEYFKNIGFDGIEAIYGSNTADQTNMFIQFARENNLFITAGSDFHGVFDNKHKDIGEVYIEGNDLDIFLKRVNEK